jgi:hypothetical protein
LLKQKRQPFQAAFLFGGFGFAKPKEGKLNLYFRGCTPVADSAGYFAVSAEVNATARSAESDKLGGLLLLELFDTLVAEFREAGSSSTVGNDRIFHGVFFRF